MRDDPDETLSMIADLTAATDPKLRVAAKQLAGRLMLDIAGSVARPRRGIGRIVTTAFRGEGDIDIDASTDADTDSDGNDHVGVDTDVDVDAAAEANLDDQENQFVQIDYELIQLE